MQVLYMLNVSELVGNKEYTRYLWEEKIAFIL